HGISASNTRATLIHSPSGICDSFYIVSYFKTTWNKCGAICLISSVLGIIIATVADFSSII
ncbi:MAG: hypothetical protein OIN85_00305, partial [Candidatus Methanoperedens sp.]|nr:hypothetical protein [Candidatus Methanoperedens sp.]